MIVKVQRTTGDPVAAERFRREAAVMKRLRHPNIVAMYQFHDGDPAALVLEYVPGRTLAELVEADGWLSPLRAAQVIEEIAAALDCAHAQGVIHRDVKPSNILLPRRGPARLYDFGVAHTDEDMLLTLMGDILGTIEYASPEQVHGNETPDARSDVYSLAAVTYFALAKTPPFPAADNSAQAQFSVMHRQVFADPPPLRFHREGLSPVVEAAVLRGLAKSPAARYPSAGQFAATLRAAAEAGAGPPEQRAITAASRRTGVLSGALAAATLLLLGVLALWRTGQFTAPRPARVAQGTPPKPLLPRATAPVPVAPKPKAAPSVILAPTAPHQVGWYTVSGWVPVSTLDHKSPLVRASVQWVKVDGQPVLALARGGWAQLPAGKHVVTFQPTPALGIGPKTWNIDLTPQAHLSQQIPFAAVPALTARLVSHPIGQLLVSGWLPVTLPGRKPRLVSVAAKWIKIDGRPSLGLAHGRWVSLPAGRHVLVFQPMPGSGANPSTRVITLLPQSRLNQLVPLSAAPLSATPLHLRNP